MSSQSQQQQVPAKKQQGSSKAHLLKPTCCRRTKLKISTRSSVDVLNLQEHAAADSPENR